jgi:hypothetical protein
MRPGPNSSIAHIFARFPVRIGHVPRADQPTLAWDTGTWFSPRAAARLPANAMNRRCLDISKSTVDRIWGEIAGYSITVDPQTAQGPIVEKPEINAVKGGRVIDGPIERPRRGMVYERLVDARNEDGSRVLHLRAVVIGSRIVFTYAKWRPYPEWFRGQEFTEPQSTDELLSADEAATVLRFADGIGLEYGELDIVRDRDTRLIYVVDANRNPVRPRGLPLTDEAENAAFEAQAMSFQALIQGWR